MRLQALHPRVRIEAHLLDRARVDDEADAVDRHRGLRHVGRQDALAHAARRQIEDALLLGDGERRVQRQHHPAPRRRRVLPQRFHQPFNLLNAREKAQCVPTLAFVELRVDPLEHLEEELRPEQLVRAARQHLAARRAAAVGGVGDGDVGVGGHVDDVDGVGAPRHAEDGRAAEEGRKELEVQGGRHEHEAERRAAREQPAHRAEQHVGARVPLVHLVQHDHVEVVEPLGAAGDVAQHHAFGHEDDPVARRRARLEADLVAHAVLAVALDRHAARERDRREPPRLRARDATVLAQQELRHLRRLAAARVARQHEHLRGAQRLEDAVGVRGDRQLGARLLQLLQRGGALFGAEVGEERERGAQRAQRRVVDAERAQPVGRKIAEHVVVGGWRGGC